MSGASTSTRARAVSVRAAASPISRSPMARVRAPVFSARSARAPSRIFGSDPLEATARPARSRRSLASRWSWAASRASRSWAPARSNSAAARARSLSCQAAKADQPPPTTRTPRGVSATMRSTCSRSTRSWLATSTPPRQSRSSARTATRPGPSRLLVGSSSRIRSGASTSRRAIPTRVRSPPDRVPIRRSRGHPGRPASARAASRRGSRVQSAASRSSALPSPARTRLSTAKGSATPRASASVHASGQSCRSRPTVPDRRTEPAAGSTRPAATCRSEDLPEPLRPTRPIRSAPRERVRSSKRGRPSGVRRVTPSRVRKADIASRVRGRDRATCDVRPVVHGGALLHGCGGRLEPRGRVAQAGAGHARRPERAPWRCGHASSGTCGAQVRRRMPVSRGSGAISTSTAQGVKPERR